MTTVAWRCGRRPRRARAALVEGAPDHFFRPPYVGGRGWLGVYLDRGL